MAHTCQERVVLHRQTLHVDASRERDLLRRAAGEHNSAQAHDREDRCTSNVLAGLHGLLQRCTKTKGVGLLGVLSACELSLPRLDGVYDVTKLKVSASQIGVLVGTLCGVQTGLTT